MDMAMYSDMIMEIDINIGKDMATGRDTGKYTDQDREMGMEMDVTNFIVSHPEAALRRYKLIFLKRYWYHFKIPS
jgi:hypothetical protein